MINSSKKFESPMAAFIAFETDDIMTLSTMLPGTNAASGNGYVEENEQEGQI
ncbi:MAG: hypothetical protein IJY08_04180 [Clostridia bacterium]|nr:hypothetical protein [Clostridia bacterium]